jgi:6,7-dimethyl-8-ribityllumazine synthase
MHLLIVEADYYKPLQAELIKGATQAIEAAGGTYDVVSVPGALEIPGAVSMAAMTDQYDGYVALGVVIRGETTHYDTVCNESARALMNLTVTDKLCIGNGIQTVENEQQAWVRAKVDDKNKGGGAAQAAIAMIELKQKFSS